MIDHTRVVFFNRVEYHDSDGKLHRTDGPALEWSNGTGEWYLHGVLHRDDGPAVEWDDGDKHWYLRGEHHRIDGPAVEFSDGYKAWYIHGKRHRVGGPARVASNGAKVWFLEHVEYTEQDYWHIVWSDYTTDAPMWLAVYNAFSLKRS